MNQHTSARASKETNGGFTMIELLVTMVLLTIVITGLAALQVTTIRQVTGSKLASQASRLAQSVLSHYETRPYPTLVAFTPKNTWVPELQRDGSTEMTRVGVDGESEPNGPFTVHTLVESVGGGILVTVRVTWTGIDRALETTPAQQYRQYKVTMSLQRFQ